jgi:TPR repeat protein
MAASGQGSPLDLQQAYIWLSMAAAAGVAGAEKSLRQTAARMRETDLARVREQLAAIAG